ncbi:MAG: hypothetical protein AAFY39_19115, partial [Pseudomonadota bacterium]
MEYGRREPLKSASAKEPTAFTMKTIQELLEIEAQQNVDAAEAPTARMPMPKQSVQTPPHLKSVDPFPGNDAAPQVAAYVPQAAE